MSPRFLVMGATSGIGRLAMEEALSRGHDVRAFARSAETLEDRPALERFGGDALNASDVAEALSDVDAVIYEVVPQIWTGV